MKKLITLVLAVAMLGASCNRPNSDQGIPQYADGVMSLAGREISIEIASTPERQSKGLGGRTSLEENQGMLFDFAVPYFPVFWMKGMNFPIDIIWIKGDQVVDISPDVPHQPGVQDSELKSYTPKTPADRVLELKAGWASRNGLKIGDKVEITQVVR